MRRAILVLLMLIAANNAFAAATCVSTKSNITEANQTYLVVVEFAWTSHTDGTVSSVGAITGISGILVSAEFIPSAVTETKPSDSYDVTILDQYGKDVLNGSGANLSNDAAAVSNFVTPYSSTGGYTTLWKATLTPAITNAGSGKSGIVRLILK